MRPEPSSKRPSMGEFLATLDEGGPHPAAAGPVDSDNRFHHAARVLLGTLHETGTELDRSRTRRVAERLAALAAASSD